MAIINIDEMWRRCKEGQAATGYRGQNWWGTPPQQQCQYQAPSQPPPQQQVQQAAPVNDCQDGTGHVYGGAGRPMDIDKLRQERKCFTCGQAGHFSRDCPHRGQRQVQAIEVVDLESNNRGPVSQVTAAHAAFEELSTDDRAALAKELGFVSPPL